MKTTCPRCKATFQCESENIQNCFCSKYSFLDEILETLKEKYGHKCLCTKCLAEIRENRIKPK